MQRMKGQGTPVPNGPKDQNFSSFQNYSNPMTSSIPGPSDPYLSSFYMTPSPYQTYGVGDASWSNGEQHMQTFLGGYSGYDPIDGIFSGGNFGGFNAPGFNYGYGNSDYNAWGSDVRNNGKYDDYYQRNVYTDEHTKTIEQGMQGIALSESKQATDISKEQVDRNALSNSDKISNEGSISSDHAGISGLTQPKKGLSWANVASQPAKPQPSRRREKTILTAIVPGRHMDIGTWEGKNGGPKPAAPPPAPRPAWDAPRGVSRSNTTSYITPPPQVIIDPDVSPQLHMHPPVAPNVSMQPPSYHPILPPHQISPQQFHQSPPAVLSQHSPQQGTNIIQSQQSPIPVTSARLETAASPKVIESDAMVPQQSPIDDDDSPTLDDLHLRNEYNPKECEMCYENARFFVIKSYSEDDIHRSIKYEIWCSTEHGNKRLDCAFRERENKGPIFLFFSVNGSGHFCGIAQMISPIDYSSSSSVWAQDKWKGKFKVKWVYVKDVPNSQLRHIRLENNENKPVTNSRDTQEVPFDNGKQVIKIIHGYRNKTSIFDDFIHYEKRQEETEFRRGHQEVDRDPRRSDLRCDPRNESRDHRGDSRGEHMGDSRDQMVDSRDHRVDPREHRIDPRDHRVDPRDHRGDPRDHMVDSRDHRGDPRDHRGDSRDHRGDSRDHRGDSRDNRGDRRNDARGDQRFDYNEHRDHRSERDYHRGGSIGGRSRGHYHHHRGGNRQ